MNGHNGHGPHPPLSNGSHHEMLTPRMMGGDHGYRADLMIEAPMREKHRAPLIPTKNYMEVGLFMA